MRIIISILCLCASISMFGQSSNKALDIIKKYQAASSIVDLQSTIKYKNISKKGRVQERSLEQFILQKDAKKNTYNFLLKFVSPADISGTSSLTIQHSSKSDDQWLYLPALRRAKKISASKKGDRFMGTEMTYEDLSNYLSEPMEDYTYQFSADTKKDESCWVIDATPRDRANSKYSKRTIWIDKVTFQQIQTHFYNKKNVLEKIFEAKDIRKIDGTDLYKAHYIKIENILTKNKTEVYYEDFVINKGIDENIFSKSYIETL